MQPWFRAVAIDYDGTLCTEGRPSLDVLAAMRAARLAGLRVVLVTGRILSELRADAPDVDQWFDAIVAENGGVLSIDGADRALSRPVDPGLAAALDQQGVSFRAGAVVLATDTTEGGRVLEHVRALGLDCHLLHNRSALMVLPADISKGSGLNEALCVLGVSPRDCIGIGDAENDHALLDACEFGVAVANAVPALQRHADMVLQEPNGEGVAAFLRALARGEGTGAMPTRRFVHLGLDEHGADVDIPAAQVSVLIRGGSGCGKSYLAGLFAERVQALGYLLCVIDPEGDHAHLASRPGVVSIGGNGPLVPVSHVVGLLARRIGSVVVDLSLYRPEVSEAYARDLLDALLELRRRTGLPHWILVDEAHVPLRIDDITAVARRGLPAGLCVVTYRPEWLGEGAAGPHDVVIDAIHPELATVSIDGRPPQRFRPAVRAVPHKRHLHKYLDGTVPHRNQFRFRHAHGPTGATARNLREFGTELRRAADPVIVHHLMHGDFSRWVRDVFRDEALSTAVHTVETDAPDAGAARTELCRLLDDRYPPP